MTLQFICPWCGFINNISRKNPYEFFLLICHKCDRGITIKIRDEGWE
jgi:hypothetical protein